MIRGMIAALVTMALATPALAVTPCEPKPPLCHAKKDRASSAEQQQRKAPRQEACVKRYALM